LLSTTATHTNESSLAHVYIVLTVFDDALPPNFT